MATKPKLGTYVPPKGLSVAVPLSKTRVTPIGTPALQISTVPLTREQKIAQTQNAYAGSRSLAEANARSVLASDGFLTGQEKQAKYANAGLVNNSLRGGNDAGGFSNRNIDAVSTQLANLPTPQNQIQKVGSLSGADSLRFSSENPEIVKNLQSAYNAGEYQESSFLNELDPNFQKSLASGTPAIAPTFAPRTRDAISSAFGESRIDKFSPYLQKSLKGADDAAQGGSGFDFSPIDETSITNPLGIQGRRRKIRSVENQEIGKYFDENIATGKISFMVNESGGVEISGSTGDQRVDAATIALFNEQYEGPNAPKLTPEQRAKKNQRIEALQDQLAFAQQDSITNNGGEQGVKFNQDLDAVRSFRFDALTGRDTNLQDSRNTSGNFDLSGVDINSRIDALQKQGLDTLKKTVNDQRAALESRFQSQISQLDAQKKAQEDVINSQYDDILESQLSQFSSKFNTDSFGNLTPSGAAFKAKVIQDVQDRKTQALRALEASYSSSKNDLFIKQSDSLLELDSKVSQAEIDFIKSRAEALAKQQDLEQKTLIENNKATISFENSKNLAEFKANLLAKAKDTNIDLTKVVNVLRDIDAIKDPSIAQSALQSLDAQLKSRGMDINLGDFSEFYNRKQDDRDLFTQQKEASILRTNQLASGSSSSSSSGTKYNQQSYELANIYSVDELNEIIAGNGYIGKKFVALPKYADEAKNILLSNGQSIYQQVDSEPSRSSQIYDFFFGGFSDEGSNPDDILSELENE